MAINTPVGNADLEQQVNNLGAPPSEELYSQGLPKTNGVGSDEGDWQQFVAANSPGLPKADPNNYNQNPKQQPQEPQPGFQLPNDPPKLDQVTGSKLSDGTDVADIQFPNQNQPAEQQKQSTDLTVDAISESIGIDLKSYGFTDPQQALAYARMHLADRLRSPAAPTPQQQQQPAQQQQQSEENPFELNFEFGDEYTDERVKNNFDTMKKAYNAVVDEVKSLKQERQAEVQARRQADWTVIEQRSNSLIDAANPDRYGKPGQRNPIQQNAVQNVQRTVADIIQRYVRAGEAPPAIEAITQQAILIDSGQIASLNGSVQPTQTNFPKQPTLPVQQSQPRAMPAFPPTKTDKNYGPNDFHEDPIFLQMAKRITGR